MPRTGRDALLNEGLPTTSAAMTRHSTANAPASLTKESRGIACEIRQDDAGSGSMNRCKRFHHGPFIFQPSAFHGGHQHAELARNLVRRDGHGKTIARLP